MRETLELTLQEFFLCELLVIKNMTFNYLNNERILIGIK